MFNKKPNGQIRPNGFFCFDIIPIIIGQNCNLLGKKLINAELSKNNNDGFNLFKKRENILNLRIFLLVILVKQKNI